MYVYSMHVLTAHHLRWTSCRDFTVTIGRWKLAIQTTKRRKGVHTHTHTKWEEWYLTVSPSSCSFVCLQVSKWYTANGTRYSCAGGKAAYA